MIMYSLLAFISKIMGQNSDVMIERLTKTLRRPTKKLRRLAIIWDYHVCNITIILGIFCPENKKKLL